MIQRHLLALQLVVLIGLGVYSSLPAWNRSQCSDQAVTCGGGPDAIKIVQGSDAGEVARWWTGPWLIYPANAYYRPLASTLLWLELKAFGPQGIVGMNLVHTLSHLACVLVAFLFVRELLKVDSVAFLAVAIWTLSLQDFLLLASGHNTMLHWITSVDIWQTLFILLSLWAFTIHARTGRWRMLLGSVVALAAGALCKEFAYLTPALAVVILWHDGALRKWRSLLPLVAASAAVLVARVVFTNAYHGREGIGTNVMWLHRAAQNFGINAATISGDLLPLSIAAAGLALVLPRRERLVLVGVAVVTFLATPWLFSENVGDTALRVMGSSVPWGFAVLIAVQYLLVRRYFIARDRGATVGLAWALILYVPALLAVFATHGFYPVGLGWGIFLAYPVRAVVLKLRNSIPAPRSADTQSVAS